MNNKDIRFLVVIIMLIVLGIATATLFSPASAIIVTNPVTVNASQWCAQFNGTNTGAADDVWFEYTMNRTDWATFSFKTENSTAVTGDFGYDQCGYPLLPGYEYVVRAASITGKGANETFVLPTLTPNPTLTYSSFVNQFLGASKQPKTLIHVVWLPYTTILGGFFFGILMAGIFWNLAIKQRTIALTIILMMLIGTTLWTLFPEYPELKELAQMLFIAGLIGMIYWLFSKRRK